MQNGVNDSLTLDAVDIVGNFALKRTVNPCESQPAGLAVNEATVAAVFTDEGGTFKPSLAIRATTIDERRLAFMAEEVREGR